MRASRRLVAAASALLAAGALAGVGTEVASAAPPPTPAAPRPLPAHSERPVCAPPAAFTARCDAHVVTYTDGVTPLASASYQSGYSPADLQSAYQLPSSTASPTVAIVDAYDNPNVQADLAAYRHQFGLPVCGSDCFSKVDQNGGTSYPSGDTNWGAEIDLDVEMVSAACPSCHILLVEAASNNFSDLMTAEQYATNHASFVSNSWGGNEFSGENAYDSYFPTGVPITVSSGDNGYGVQYPAASPNVTAVGGTSLTQSNGAWAETAWSGAGSGCSAVETKPLWQKDTGCSRRTVADVSAVADPNTGVAVYDSYGSSGGANWYVYGGTSVAAPFVAAVWALAGTPTSPAAQTPYDYTGGWTDITSGSNTRRCRSGYLCQAVPGYDGPTGLGTPIGASGFGGTAGVGSTNAPPVASFTESCSGLTCNFTDVSSDSDGTVTGWSWNFGDGSTSTAQDPSHTYAAGSTYTVSLTVTDNGGATDSTSQQVTVTGPTTGGSAAIASASCTGAQCSFTGTGTSPLTWSDTANVLTTNSDGSATTRYSSPTTDTVTLTAGDGSTASKTVTCTWSGHGRNKTLACTLTG